ncbi:GlxA family transcriptional regulator [Actinocorallia populi]|uniref:GlxA family transcriptional regulator n=1 Tax=Actinocorallia populi TaxID=2079200 RepID=UPI000D08735A|nr:helix-turn-helix domain-containing protein [Actinocorallia populi]
MKIAIHAFDGVTMFHLAVPQLVFAEVGRLEAAPEWTTVLWSTAGETVTTAEGHVLGPVEGPDVLDTADMLIIPSWPERLPEADADLVGHLRRAHARGAEIVGLCLGAFAVADTGLLAGRSAVTHWAAMERFSARHPDVAVDTSVLYIDHGDVMTSAGTASGLDACLHIVRKHLGAAAANRLARTLVVAPHREGGQAQYIERPVSRAESDAPIAEVMAWALGDLAAPLHIDALAERACLSRRGFVRRFREATGSTPAKWVLDRRLDKARELLETTSWGVDRIAAHCGFGSEVTLRQNFSARYATTPGRYRRRFRGLNG